MTTNKNKHTPTHRSPLFRLRRLRRTCPSPLSALSSPLRALRSPLRALRSPLLAPCSMLLALCLLTGCISFAPKADPTRFYLLESVENPAKEPNVTRTYFVGLKKVAVPGYLNSRKIALRKGKTEIQYSEFNRWAENFDDIIEESLRANLLAEPAVAAVSTYPWLKQSNLDFIIDVQFIKFEGNTNGEVNLLATWTVTNQKEPGKTFRGTTSLKQIREDRTYDSLVTAMSLLLQKLSKDISVHIKPTRSN